MRVQVMRDDKESNYEKLNMSMVHPHLYLTSSPQKEEKRAMT